MRAFRRVALVLASACYLAASLSPCPATAAAGSAVAHSHLAAAHAPDCHAAPADRVLDAPCPCGCEGRGAPPVGSARVGLALLTAVPAPAPRPDTRPWIREPMRLSEAPISPPDHVPLAR